MDEDLLDLVSQLNQALSKRASQRSSISTNDSNKHHMDDSPSTGSQLMSKSKRATKQSDSSLNVREMLKKTPHHVAVAKAGNKAQYGSLGSWEPSVSIEDLDFDQEPEYSLPETIPATPTSSPPPQAPTTQKGRKRELRGIQGQEKDTSTSAAPSSSPTCPKKKKQEKDLITISATEEHVQIVEPGSRDEENITFSISIPLRSLGLQQDQEDHARQALTAVFPSLPGYIIALTPVQIRYLTEAVDRECSDFNVGERAKLKKEISSCMYGFAYWQGWFEGMRRGMNQAKSKSLEIALKEIKSHGDSIQQSLADCNTLADTLKNMSKAVEGIQKEANVFVSLLKEITQRISTTTISKPSVPLIPSSSGVTSASSASSYENISKQDTDKKTRDRLYGIAKQLSRDEVVQLLEKYTISREHLSSLQALYGILGMRVLLLLMDKDKKSFAIAKSTITSWVNKFGTNF